MNLSAIYITNNGKNRNNNEDALSINGNIISEQNMTEAEIMRITVDRTTVIACTDGMGGYDKGEEAAKILAEMLAETKDSFLLEKSINSAARKMKDNAEGREEYRGYGAVTAGIIINEDFSYTAFNVGDCRVYRYRNGYMEKLTKDHSLIQTLIDNGEISEEEGSRHIKKNVVTSAVTNDDSIKIETYQKKIRNIVEGDIILIMSDGIWEGISTDDMEAILGTNKPYEAVNKIAYKVMNDYGEDNLSLIAVYIEMIGGRE